ncbi:MAG TPA: LysR substrate-binding domain-containing protein [Steroidobacteraceae bacterium]|nr:LysR substrate-binding domain-containing protein [Steroidobacteraceae bacterium]
MMIADVLLFVRIAETLSFKEAAKHLSISRSQASKRIAALEDELGTTLIYRSPRSISLTSAGETLFAHYRRIFDMMEEARLAVEHLSNAPLGRLRFSMPTCLGSGLLPKLNSEFLPRYPGIVLDAHTSETCVDIVAGGYDVAIRVALRLTDSTLTARRLATSPMVLAAAPSYLQERGTPSHPAELARHRCLGLQRAKEPSTAWHFRAGSERFNVPIDFWAASDTNLALVRAACSGLGFVYVPLGVIANKLQHGALRIVLPEFCRGIEAGIYAVHAGRTPTKNAAVFIDFVRDALLTFDGIASARFTTRPPVASSEREIPYPARAGGH